MNSMEAPLQIPYIGEEEEEEKREEEEEGKEKKEEEEEEVEPPKNWILDPPLSDPTTLPIGL
jgi:hypothetical protein